MLGLHWLLDADDCPAEKLADRALLEEQLAFIPDALGLTRVGPPQVFESETGCAGTTLISESHFSIHTDRSHGRLHVDLFSCRAFDVDRAMALLEDAYGFSKAKTQVLERGGDVDGGT